MGHSVLKIDMQQEIYRNKYTLCMLPSGSIFITVAILSFARPGDNSLVMVGMPSTSKELSLFVEKKTKASLPECTQCAELE